MNAVWKLLVLVAAAALPLAGCGNIKQINRIAFVTAIGVDKGEHGFKVHALVAVPGRFSSLSPGGSGSSNAPPTFIITEEAANLSEALYEMKRKSGRDLQYGHTKVILFDEAVAQAGLNPHLDLFMRRAEFQPIMWMGVTPGTTKSVLSKQPQLPESVSDYFVDVFSQAGSDSLEVLPMFMFEFYSMSAEPGQSPCAMVVKPIQESNKFEMSGLAVFHGDKMVGQLTPKETMLIQFLQNQPLKPALFTVAGTSLNVLGYKTKVEVKEDEIRVNVKFRLDVDQQAGSTLVTPEQVRELETKTQKLVKKQMTNLLKKLRRLKSDPAGIGNRYRSSVTNKKFDMDEWLNRTFPKLTPVVTVEARIERRGTIR